MISIYFDTAGKVIASHDVAQNIGPSAYGEAVLRADVPDEWLTDEMALADFVDEDAFFNAAKVTTLTLVEGAADEYRKKIAGNIGSLKAAEYADKARIAERMINGEPVSDDAIAEAKSEMVSLGMAADEASADHMVIAQIWKAKYGVLMRGRSMVNVIERESKALVRSAETLEDLVAAIQASFDKANAALAKFVESQKGA